MFLLDTNILSDLMRAEPDPTLARWLAARRADELHLSTVTMAEILLGVALLPEGRRKAALEAQALAMFDEDFRGRILPFDDAAARRYGALAAEARAKGRALHAEDGMIAAIAAAYGMTIVSRDRDLHGLGVAAIDPSAPA